MPSMTVEHKTQRTLENDPFRTVMQTPRNNAVKMTLQKDCELCDMDGCIMWRLVLSHIVRRMSYVTHLRDDTRTNDSKWLSTCSFVRYA